MSNDATRPDDEPTNQQVSVPPVPPEVLKLERSDPKTYRAVEQYILQVAVHSGPLPSPQQLAEYDRACPGAALEILGMAKTEQGTRHHCMRAEVDAIKRGQLCAISAFALAMIATCYLASVGAYGAAATLGGSAITVFGGAFILSRHLSAKQDQPEKPKPSPPKKQKPKR